MEIGEIPCVVLGPIGFHRLAELLFDYPIHFLISGPGLNESDEVASFQKLVHELRELSSASNHTPEVSIVETKPNIYTVTSSAGKVDCFGPEGLSREEDILHPFVSIGQVPIIDPASLTDDLVREFRKDLESRTKLKRLRVFAYTNYSGKPISFVQDDLEIRIQDYRSASKKWGLETLRSALTISAADKVLSSACAGLASSVFGLPLAEAAAIGTVAALGTTVVQIKLGKKLFELNQSQNAVSYLVDIQNSAIQLPNE